MPMSALVSNFFAATALSKDARSKKKFHRGNEICGKLREALWFEILGPVEETVPSASKQL
jgi:hypothetical protein